MNKKIKILAIMNLISYLLIGYMYYLFRYEYIDNLNNLHKFILVQAILLLILITSFVLANDAFKELTLVKNEVKLDWIVRIIAFGIVFIGISKNLQQKNLVLVVIIMLMIINFAIEYYMNKKMRSYSKEENKKEIVNISYEEKCNLRNMVKATNSFMISFLVLCSFSMSVPTLKNMEGTEKTSFIPIIVSVLVIIWFLKTSYNNYMIFYLDKRYSKNIFIKNSIFVLLGYIICLSLSFVKFEIKIYDYIFIIGIVFTIPTIQSMRKMSLRLREIRESIGVENYNYFINKEN
ncbi:MAG: hypothetical protein E7212_00135 [Clostridium sartagoforme]|nr:hypothetical protein [Clostridium sartagoforme]